MRKLLLVMSIAMAIALSLQFGVSNARAARKRVNCAKVMEELGAGKKVAVVAKDQKISPSSVYRCRRRAKEEAKQKAKEAKAKGKPGAPAASAASKM
jgi:transposase